MILIADGGSTRTTWCLIGGAENTIFETEGYHPFFVDSVYISQSLDKNIPQEIKKTALDVSEIFFYSAGGGYSMETDGILVAGITTIFPNAEIVVETDLLAAARALLQNKAGFAAILGTGTNTCLYDGSKITHNIESLGFYLGDEGSGSYIGKKIIGDYVRGYMPPEVEKAYAAHIELTPEELLEKVYTDQTPNSFCAQSSKFVGENLHNSPYYNDLVHNSFCDLFSNIVIHYPNYTAYSFNCVGSVAYYFHDILKNVALEYGMEIGNILKKPMDGLVQFHLSE